MKKKTFVKSLRINSTDAESVLWYNIRNRHLLGYKFRRQVSIGKYVVDFLCPEKHLVIELDGSQHLLRSEYDQLRTNFLEKMGFNVLRYWNNDVLDNLDGVLSDIIAYLVGDDRENEREVDGE